MAAIMPTLCLTDLLSAGNVLRAPCSSHERTAACTNLYGREHTLLKSLVASGRATRLTPPVCFGCAVYYSQEEEVVVVGTVFCMQKVLRTVVVTRDEILRAGFERERKNLSCNLNYTFPLAQIRISGGVIWLGAI